MTKKELEKTVKFLCMNNKDDVGSVIQRYITNVWRFCTIRFQYLYNGKLMETKEVICSSYNVISNHKDNAIIETYDELPYTTTLYKLDKETAKLTEIKKEDNNNATPL